MLDFCFQIVESEIYRNAASTLMAYSSLAEVKTVLQITEATWDTEITDCITSADAIIDSLLKTQGLVVPGSVPQNIKDASKHFAAWLFRRRKDPAGADVFWVEGQRFIQVYIDAEVEGANFKVALA